MLNQVQLEGYLISQWRYGGSQYVRVASHNTPEGSGQVVSDYVTVRVSDDIIFDAKSVSPGTLLRITGKVWGRDILEPLGRVLKKSGIELNLAPGVADTLISRPTTFIEASQITPIRERDAAEQVAVSATQARSPRKASRRKAKTPPPESEVPAPALAGATAG